ncbi:MAG: cysteine dioxygenase family protein [Phycisphaeraceae bacterium]|nr:cysteine dioxygenase family protein [Phycisphaeraceae bacterium]
MKPGTRELILGRLTPYAALPAKRDEVAEAFKRITISEAEARACGHFSPGERTRFEIAKAEAFVLLAIFWDNMQSPIHDHDESDCGFKVIAGDVEETRFKVVEGELVTPVATRRLKSGESARSTGESIHRLGVPRGEAGQSITLHLYCPILGYDAMGIYREVDEAGMKARSRQRDHA